MTIKFDHKGNGFEIRTVSESDMETLLHVYQQCEDFLALGPVPIASMEMVLKDIELSKAEGGIFCGIYSAENEMIGVIDYVPQNYLGNSHHAFLELLMITKPYRKMGLGKIIVNAFENEIKRNPQIQTIFSGVQVNNPKAIDFWTRNGYAIISDATLMADGTTAYALRKDIN